MPTKEEYISAIQHKVKIPLQDNRVINKISNSEDRELKSFFDMVDGIDIKSAMSALSELIGVEGEIEEERNRLHYVCRLTFEKRKGKLVTDYEKIDKGWEEETYYGAGGETLDQTRASGWVHKFDSKPIIPPHDTTFGNSIVFAMTPHGFKEGQYHLYLSTSKIEKWGDYYRYDDSDPPGSDPIHVWLDTQSPVEINIRRFDSFLKEAYEKSQRKFTKN